jgi:hypothetical protein
MVAPIQKAWTLTISQIYYTILLQFSHIHNSTKRRTSSIQEMLHPLSKPRSNSTSSCSDIDTRTTRSSSVTSSRADAHALTTVDAGRSAVWRRSTISGMAAYSVATTAVA